MVLLTAGCAARGDVAGTARSWASGPVRWLIQPDEARRLRGLEDGSEALAFIEAFWRRRDPEPHLSGNPASQTFFERVQAADLLYPEAGVAGSLTDRGRALILLGPPDGMRLGQKTVPTLASGDLGGDLGKPRPQGTQQVRVEIWTYSAEELSTALLARLAEEGLTEPEQSSQEVIQLTFVQDRERTRLESGEAFLEAASRALVLRDL